MFSLSVSSHGYTSMQSPWSGAETGGGLAVRGPVHRSEPLILISQRRRRRCRILAHQVRHVGEVAAGLGFGVGVCQTFLCIGLIPELIGDEIALAVRIDDGAVGGLAVVVERREAIQRVVEIGFAIVIGVEALVAVDGRSPVGQNGGDDALRPLRR